MKNNKLSTAQLMLMSTGGMIGCGWLFSPYYGFETAGVGVLLSWLIVAILTLIIALTFAEVITIAPIVGGLSRFIGITHNRTTSFVFLAVGWLSYVVYLPIEVQSAMQYFSFWCNDLVIENQAGITLSKIGLFVSFALITLLTWFNCFLLKNVARVNSLVSIWKILAPIAIAWVLIALFGSWENVNFVNLHHEFSLEKSLLAITGSGLAFAFTGFQNGLILANSTSNPRKALPYSLFAPILIGLILYSSLSLIYIACLGDKKIPSGSAAPLLGIVSLFGIHVVINILFIDAVLAPLGTANVYTAATSRILLGLAKDFFPKTPFNKLNKFSSPAYCLWFNAFVGAGFLLPFPTWQQLVDFLSSVVVFSYLAGPIVLIVLRQELPELNRPFKLLAYKLIGYGGFACCSLLIYWSNIRNLIYLAALTGALILIHILLIEKKPTHLINSLKSNFFISAYLLALLAIKFLHQEKMILFPIDNIFIVTISYLACRIFVGKKVNKKQIQSNLERISKEVEQC
ncbi:MAG: APC family permease [Proteobacteria bacterium]|nr:APC family permease [Pseudomonadota bacterium]